MNINDVKEEICDIGRRIYAKNFAAGNDGNITYRLNEREVLCTPTMISKGFMKPDDICLVDMEGNQLAGKRKRTSEVLLHLTIMKARPDVRSVVHCHPPHATAFAIAREAIPQCVLPEIEVFLGDVPITKYATPGGQHFADTVLPFVHKSNVMILANHGTVSYGETVEKAYWWTEILDAYCNMLMMARDLGRISFFNEGEERELLALKKKWGFADARFNPGMENCDICANDVFRDSWKETGVDRRAFPTPPPMKPKCNDNAGSCGCGCSVPAPAAAPAVPAAALNPIYATTQGAPPVIVGPTSTPAATADAAIEPDQLVKLITERVLAALKG